MVPAPKPRVLILIATDAIGGPGKGLFQFLSHFSPAMGEYILANFFLPGRPDGQFVDEARNRKLNLVLLNQRARVDPGMVVQAMRIIREQRINIIQTHGHKTHVIGFFVRLLCGTPWIAFAHGYIQGGWKTRLYNWIDRKMLRHADRVVTVSGSMTTLAIACGVREEKIRLIYNAVDPTAARPGESGTVRARHGITPDETVVAVVGRFSPEKGHLTFLQALAEVSRNCPHVKAVLVGDGEDRSALEAYVRDHELGNHVVFAGYRADIDEYYRAMDLLVLPSISEGLPNVILEAMSYGVPVLATRVGGVPEIIDGHNGVLVAPGNAGELAERMAEFLSSASLRTAVGEAGRRSLYPRFAAEHRARQIIQVYAELVRDAESS